MDMEISQSRFSGFRKGVGSDPFQDIVAVQDDKLNEMTRRSIVEQSMQKRRLRVSRVELHHESQFSAP
jgi:hypothetical protein